MSDQEPEQKPRRSLLTVLAETWKAGGSERTRFVIWVVLAGFGIYLVVTGIVGVMTKAR